MATIKKVNPGKQILTVRDLRKAEKEWLEMLKEMSASCTQNGELIARAIIMLALTNKFKFGPAEMIVLFEEYDRILMKIADTEGKHRNYSLKTVCKELEANECYVEETFKEKWYQITDGVPFVEQEVKKYYRSYDVELKNGARNGQVL